MGARSGHAGKTLRIGSAELDPAFVSPNVLAIDVTALWAPELATESGAPAMCTYPPFLDGTHNFFFFSIAKPFDKTPFSSPKPAAGDWGYVLKAACTGRVVCKPDTREPFEMTLICPN